MVSILNDTDNNFINGDSRLDESWSLTTQLRWKQRLKQHGNGTAEDITVLQQMWQGSMGTQEWKDVPTETE